MSRAVWKGHIAFGLVEIPVSVHPAEESEQVSFKLVDRRDRAPVGYVRVNKRTGEEVPWAEIVKGYEVADGEYVLFGKDELESVSPELTRRVDIQAFVPIEEIEHAFWSTPYYLKPTRKSGNRAYVLLRETLARTGRAGIAQVVLRTRQHLAAVVPHGPLLTLNLLRYGAELRSLEGLDLPSDLEDVELKEGELKMAEQLVSSMESEFDADAYEDTYQEKLLELVERKVQAGQTGPVDVVQAEEAPAREGGKVIDLMALLRRSVDGEKQGGGSTRKGSTRKKSPSAAAPRRRAAKTARKPARKPARKKSSRRTG